MENKDKVEVNKTFLKSIQDRFPQPVAQSRSLRTISRRIQRNRAKGLWV